MNRIRVHIILSILLGLLSVQHVYARYDSHRPDGEISHNTGTIEQVTHYYPFGAVYSDAGTNDALQRYKYNGKELDLMHGLNLYDYGARNYDPLLGRFTQMDPLAKKYYHISPFVYCANNPVRLIDIKGEEPGDFFKSIDEVAKDFGLFYNDNSIRENREYASYIFEVKDINGNKGYSYSIASVGDNKSVFIKQEMGAKNVASIHTHAAYCTGFPNNTFSGVYGNSGKLLSLGEKRGSEKNDIGNANNRKMTSYVVTPNGSLQKYNPITGKISVISNYMPSDSKDPDRLNRVNTYENNQITIKKILEMQEKISTGILNNIIK